MWAAFCGSGAVPRPVDFREREQMTSMVRRLMNACSGVLLCALLLVVGGAALLFL
mgnify:CR=1 FL=1